MSLWGSISVEKSSLKDLSFDYWDGQGFATWNSSSKEEDEQRWQWRWRTRNGKKKQNRGIRNGKKKQNKGRRSRSTKFENLSREHRFDKEESRADPMKKNHGWRKEERGRRSSTESKWWNSSLKNSSSTWIFFHIDCHHLQLEF